MDGFEATRRIRLLRQAQPMIVAVTASVLDEDRWKCFATGMDAYLSKPFARRALLSVVEEAEKRRIAPEPSLISK